MVKLRGSLQLNAGGSQAACLFLGAFGTAPDQAALELLPLRWGEENELRVGPGASDLACAGQVDFKKDRFACFEGVIDGAAGGSVLVFSMNKRPLQHVSTFDHCIEFLSGNEVVVDAVQFTGPRSASCRRDRHVERRKALRQRSDNSSLSNGCRASEDSQLSLCHDSSVPRLTASAETLDEGLPLDGAEATHAPALGDLVLVHQHGSRVRADARQRLQ